MNSVDNCDHDELEYDVDRDGQELIINDVNCPDCELTDELKRILIEKFDYDEFWASKHDVDVDYYMEMQAGIE